MKDEFLKVQDIFRNLSAEFGIPQKEAEVGVIPAGAVMGLEIKIPVSAHFSEVWQEHIIDSGKTRYADLSDAEKRYFSEALSLAEGPLRKIVSRVKSCGVEIGPWKWSELILPPTPYVEHIVGVIRLLAHPRIGLIKNIHGEANGGRTVYPLHITVGGLRRNRNSYMLLSMLELSFCSKERMAAWASWDAKGKSGLHERTEAELSLEATAVEFRTLQLPPLEKLVSFFWVTGALVGLMNQNDSIWKGLTQEIDRLMKNHGLHNGLWPSPSREGDQNWRRFADHFPVMSSEWKQFLRKKYTFLNV